MAIRGGIEGICAMDLDERALRVALLEEIRTQVPFDAYVWMLTDPQTCVGSAPLAEVPSLEDLPALIRSKYLTPVNRWTTLPTSGALTLLDATSGEAAASRSWAEVLHAYGVVDVVSTVFRDQYGCWGFLDLWRTSGAFTATECTLLRQFTVAVTPVLRHSLLSTFAGDASSLDPISGPAVLLMSDGIDILTQTPQTDAYLRALLPPLAGRSPIPSGAYNVAAQLLAREAGIDSHPASARVHLRDGMWVTLRAARIDATPRDDRATIAVTIEPTPPLQRVALYCRVAGLSDREADLLHLLVGGHDTRELARRMFVSEHTVQDHLKSIFAKAGVNNRRLLVARATG